MIDFETIVSVEARKSARRVFDLLVRQGTIDPAEIPRVLRARNGFSYRYTGAVFTVYVDGYFACDHQSPAHIWHGGESGTARRADMAFREVQMIGPARNLFHCAARNDDAHRYDAERMSMDLWQDAPDATVVLSRGFNTKPPPVAVTTIDKRLIQAYQNSRYVALVGAARIVLPLDSWSADLTRWYAHYRCNTAALITSWNARGRLTEAGANATRLERLRERLAPLAAALHDAVGEDPTGQWPAEPSFLALGIPFEEACGVGRAFHQNAILTAGHSAVFRLTLLR